MNKFFSAFSCSAKNAGGGIIEQPTEKEPEIGEPVAAILAIIASDPDRFEIKQGFDGFNVCYDVTDSVTGVVFVTNARHYNPSEVSYVSFTNWVSDEEAKALHRACSFVLENRVKKQEAILKLEAEAKRKQICELYGVPI